MRRPILSHLLVAAAALAPAAATAATLTVDTLLDVDVLDGECSLREAIVAAGSDSSYRDCPAGSGFDDIEFAVEGTIAIGADLPPLAGGGIRFAGPGVDRLTIDGGGEHRLFVVDAVGPFPFAFRNLTIRGGLSPGDGGCIAFDNPPGGSSFLLFRVLLEGCRSEGEGGAVALEGIDGGAIRESWLVDNEAASNGGALRAYGTWSLEIRDTTISGNRAGFGGTSGSGGGLAATFTEVGLQRVTVADNTARSNGGGLFFASNTANLSLLASSTVAGNRSGVGGSAGHLGGGIALSAIAGLELANSVVAGNLQDVSGVEDDLSSGASSSVSSSGYNWIGSNRNVTDEFPEPPVPGQPNVHGDWVGTSDEPIDPQLESLADWGGGIPTRRPAATSPLVDLGSCTGETRDQRGYSNPATSQRIFDDETLPDALDGCDIGAVERNPLDDLPFADGFESGDASAWSEVVP
ncbi:MAG: hypothetical protein AMXMBFR36_37270 [Acidobacteriota bacterium]